MMKGWYHVEAVGDGGGVDRVELERLPLHLCQVLLWSGRRSQFSI